MKILHKFIAYYKPHKVLFYTDMFCALIVSIIDLAFPQILSYLTKNIFTQDKSIILHALVFVGIALLAMYLIKYFCQYFITVSYTHLRAHETRHDIVCRLL